MKTTLIAAILATSSLLTACGSKTTLAPVTLTAQQVKLFEQSCKTCHANPASPAPQMGDITAWDTRIAKGLPILVQSAMQGFNAMPAGGMCTVCTPEDFEAMIRYMATAKTTTQ